jgi:hypothetical protein
MGGAEVYLHYSWTRHRIDVNGQLHDTGRYIPEERPDTYCIRDWFFSWNGLDPVEYINISFISENCMPAVQLVARRYTDWAILANAIDGYARLNNIPIIRFSRLLCFHTTRTHRIRRLQKFFVAAGMRLLRCCLATVERYTDRPISPPMNLQGQHGQIRVHKLLHTCVFSMARERVYRAVA